MGRRLPARLLAGAAVIAITGLCVACAQPARAPSHAAAPIVASGPSEPSLQMALQTSRDLGPTSPSQSIELALGLQGRDQQRLAAIINAGGRVTPQQQATQFGPDAAVMRSIEATLQQSGFGTAWQPGEMALAATGTAHAAEALFHVSIHDYITSGGKRFYAARERPTIPAVLKREVTSVMGFDNYTSLRSGAIHSANGVTPSDMLDFYDVTPLRSAGLDGTGQTIVFYEGQQFTQPDLDAFAKKFNLPPFNVQVHQNPSWGTPPTDDATEADLDLEVAHGIAPGAKLVVYYSGPQIVEGWLSEEQGIFHDYPSAIESSSWGVCEDPSLPSGLSTLNDAAKAASGTGLTMFLDSYDRGAYGCTAAGDGTDLRVEADAALQWVTGVGGTLAFLSSSGGYGAEASWGEPVEQWGSGGGVSMMWPRPTWQTGPGVQNQYSTGKRQVPDVSANADELSGWETIFDNGQDAPVGGTSAATPFWAAVAALIDQDLSQKKLPSIGFANPALYYFAQHPAGLPAPAFHDVTQGTNLYYPATPGWDYATGLGSPDVAALADDFEWYETQQTQHPSS